MNESTASPDPANQPPHFAAALTPLASVSPAPATPPPPPAAVPVWPVRDRARFFAALGNPLRWRMVQMLAAGRVICARDVAKAVQREFDGVSKHLRLLRASGVIASRPGQDRRFEMYLIPEAVRRADGVLDYGFVQLRAE